jgi:lysophospholipase L1-like esterase
MKETEKQHADVPREPRSWRAKVKFAIFSLLPLVILFVFAELFVRVCQFDRPLLGSSFLPPGFEVLHRDDPELFFSLQPNMDYGWLGTRISTSSLGLRSAELGPKQPGEFRILSLGESTTFGARVEVNQTYSAVLEKLLQAADSTRSYRVINAGVSAYSSFQSLKYLELRGLQLQPDMVLFYHEINDFLPTALRASEASLDSQSGESSLGLTDRQLYESRRQVLHRKLLATVALYRCLNHLQARRNLQQLQEAEIPSESDHIFIPSRYNTVLVRKAKKEMKLPTRVSIEERKDNLRQLEAICKQHGLRLVILHPSYSESKRHQCELTEFCEASGVPMFECYDSLHPEGENARAFFLDNWHPSPLGHRTLAEDLLRFIEDYPWPDAD